VCAKLTAVQYGQYIVEKSVRWLSDDIISFEIAVRVYEKFAEM